MSGALQWIKFYPLDWRGDQALRAVSIAARGLWIDMICIMHEAVPYGHLKLGRKTIDAPMLAHMVNTPVDEVEQLLAELKKASVYARTPRGVIYSRRMVKDARLREIGRKFAQKRWSKETPIVEETPPLASEPIGSPIAKSPRVQSLERKVGSSFQSEPTLPFANPDGFADPEQAGPNGSKPPKVPRPKAIRQALARVLSSAAVDAVIDHRATLKHPLTVRAAEILAGHFEKAPEICGLSPDQAADVMIDRGWRGFEAEWVLSDRRRDSNGSQRARSPPANASESSDEYSEENLRAAAAQLEARHARK